MIKEIKYNGYSASPSDYECADGDLAMSLNTINEDGALHSVLQPKMIMHLTAGETVRCLHKTNSYTHYITVNGSLMRYMKDNIITKIFDFSDADIYQITPVGNTLVVLTSDGIYYFLWKDDKYISLGNELPELNVSPYITTTVLNAANIKMMFKLDMSIEEDLGVSVEFKEAENLTKQDPENIAEFSEAEKTSVSETVFSVVNACSKALKERGYFLEPFYVRFAYRMYDGSYIKHTVPILLVPTTWGKPIMALKNNNGTLYCNPIFSLSRLCYDIHADIGNWKDIITHVDVFVSEPLIDYADGAESLSRVLKYNPYDHSLNSREYARPMTMDNGQWKSIDAIIEESNASAMRVIYQGKKAISRQGTWLFGYKHRILVDIKDFGDNEYLVFKPHKYHLYCKDAYNNEVFTKDIDSINEKYPGWKIFAISDMRPSQNVYFYLQTDANADDVEYVEYCRVALDLKSIDHDYYIETKRVDELEYNDVLTSCSSFYRIKEIKIEDAEAESVFDKQFVLQSLTARPVLSDIGSCNDKIISTNAFNYNSRLNVIIDKLGFTDAGTSLKQQNTATNSDMKHIIRKAYVEIYENSQYAYAEIPAEDFCLKDLSMFSYPNNNARSLVVYTVSDTDGGNEYYRYKIRLKQHDYLNLSYVFDGFTSLFGDDFSWIDESEQLSGEGNFVIPTNNTVEYGNIIRLSDVNNPFRFSEEYSVALPVSKIYALSTAAKALSQGQFGQYPLYAFTSDGIWALELTSSGTYSARQPISRDVVINPDSITQIDSAVLFVTDKGIMLISGSQVICISDTINTEDIFDIKKIPKINEIVSMFNSVSTNKISSEEITQIPLSQFLEASRMIYDYSHQRIIVYNPEVKYAYVYSFKSQLWGMMFCSLTSNVNSYPHALAADNNKLVDFSKDAKSSSAVLVITRPFKLDNPDMHKTISTVIQRGNMNDRHIAQILYGSNDLNNWVTVWSSSDIYMRGFSGTPYKYYRIAAVRDLDKSESLYGFSVQYEPRLNNRLR